MLYTCDPSPRRLAAAAKRGARRTSGPVIDIHCHIVSPEAAALVAASGIAPDEPMGRFSNEATRAVQKAQTETVRPMLTSVERRIADMDKMGVDIQAISPAPPQYFYWTPPELGRDAARLINDNIAATVARHPDRLVGLGTVPMQAPEFAVAELERAVKTLGLRGVELCTNVAGADLSEQKFRPVFAKAEELGVLVFLHPNGFPDGRRFSEHYFSNVIGNPLDSTVAVSHLIFGGVLDAYPKLKVCVAHGGGFLPAYAGRMDHAHGARSDCRLCIKKKPSWYLKKMYFDTIVFEESQLEYLVKTYGSDRILMGTDYPFDMGMYEPIEFVSGAKLTASDKQAILGGNAARLLKLKSKRPVQAKG
ncbi:amidohydrolase family protein [Reyranella sp.]|uniref:amidohydrolase family protein n=1 Tax=Reyranella sp. TaxID=1929291 RepID=UPI0025E8606C|nr:amidohydrolase family protein [Reyranella sp.]